jgi:threonine dehydrogenase-like Zn-dependent dehydrogenase
MAEKVLASTLVAPKTLEIREYDVPDIGPDEGLLRVERCGICGSDARDWGSMKRGVRILGHENVGHIARIGRNAAKRWGVKEGDRVALEEYVPCGVCAICRSGNARFCSDTDIFKNGTDGNVLWYGSTPISTQPSLWGGYAQYLYLHPNALVHKVPDSIPADEAAFYLPFSNGFEWVCNYGQAKVGDVVVVQGPGQQGLASVIAAKEAGAACVIATGIGRDSERLRIAQELGADHIVNVEEEDLADKVMDITGGYGADVVVNASGANGTLAASMPIMALNGRIVLGSAGSQQVETRAAGRKNLTIRWAHGHSYRAVELAIRAIASRKYPIGLLTKHHFGLSRADMAIRSVAGEGEPGAIHVSIDPWAA